MVKHKTLSRWFWLKVIWTFPPLVFAVVLIVGEIFEVGMRGLIIQAFVMLPLVFTFRGRLATMFHNMADLAQGNKDDAYKERTGLYRLFLFFRGSEVSVREKAWVSLFDSMGLIFLLFYYSYGIYLQHIAETHRP